MTPFRENGSQSKEPPKLSKQAKLSTQTGADLVARPFAAIAAHLTGTLKCNWAP